MGADPMEIIRDRKASIESRTDYILAFGRTRDEESLRTIADIAFDKDDKEEARTAAVRAMSHFNKRKIFPLMLDILDLSNGEIPQYLRSEAVASIYLLMDSRSLFALANLYNSLDQEKERERLFGHKILQALWNMADPRAVEFLEDRCKSKNEKTRELAGTALERSRKAGMVYTFGGDENLLEYARETEQESVLVISKKDFLSERAKKLFEEESTNCLCFATYVVCPENPEDPSEGCKFILGPRRTEHVFVAQGQDLLAAGEIGVDRKNNFSVEYLNNHSGGYLPAPNSFFWVKRALGKADVEIKLKEFSTLYPPEGYFTDGFLSSQPLYNL